MPVSVNNYSRLMLGELKLIDGIEFWDLLDLPRFYPHTNDIIYEVADGDSLDRIAYNYYQNPVLWWVIAWANDMELPQRVLTAGMTLVIPAPDYVMSQLFKTKKSRV